jgi:hypothetical protein
MSGLIVKRNNVNHRSITLEHPSGWVEEVGLTRCSAVPYCGSRPPDMLDACVVRYRYIGGLTRLSDILTADVLF